MSKTIRRNSSGEWSVEGRAHSSNKNSCLYKKKALLKANSASSGRELKQAARVIFRDAGEWYEFI